MTKQETTQVDPLGYPCPKAWNLQHIDDPKRLKIILEEAEFHKRRVDQYMAAVRMRMKTIYDQRQKSMDRRETNGD